MAVAASVGGDGKDAAAVLDAAADSNGMNESVGDDWSDVKNSERKKRDRILPDDVVVSLMVKSDLEGARRLAGCLCILCATGFNLWCVLYLARYVTGLAWLLLVPAMLAHGFVFQSLAYAGQHETMHGTAFRTRWLNRLVSFLVSLPCFEFSTHERLMHKSHHTWTNDPDRDPELTSFFSHASKKKGFRKVADSQADYWKEFFFLHETLKSHFGRLIFCALGEPTDYTGVGWSLPLKTKGLVRAELQYWAIIQLSVYGVGIPMLCNMFGWQNLAYYWLIPAVVGFAPINFIRNGEHSDCSMDLNGLSNTRSTKTHAIVQYLLWNMNYHAEHHLYPPIPFYNLPKLRTHLESHLKNKTGSFTEVNRLMYTQWIHKQANEIVDK